MGRRRRPAAKGKAGAKRINVKARELPSELKEAIARVYYAVPFRIRGNQSVLDALPRYLPSEMLAARHLTARDIGAVVEELELHNKVFHTVLGKDEDVDFPPRCATVERQLMGRHKGLLHAMIIRSGKPPTTQGEVDSGYGATLHQRLGACAASLLLACLRPKDRLAVGGGRAPLYTAEHVGLRRGLGSGGTISDPPIACVMSLTGRMSRQPADHTHDHFDADRVAGKLADIFYGSGVKELRVDKPLVCEDPHAAPRGSPLQRREWKEWLPIDVALVGIGAFTPPHRMCGPVTPDLRGAAAELKVIQEAQGVIDGSFKDDDANFHAVGDICNTLFFIPPPAEWLEKKTADEQDALHETMQKLQHAIATLNEKVHAATLEDIQQIAREGVVIAVAGGPAKRYAIRHVLNYGNAGTGGGRLLTHLVTDDLVAQWLLESPCR